MLILLTPRKSLSDCVMTASCVQLNSSMYTTNAFAMFSNDGIVRKNLGNSSRSLRIGVPEEKDNCSSQKKDHMLTQSASAHTFIMLIIIYLWDIPKVADLCDWLRSSRTATTKGSDIRWL